MERATEGFPCSSFMGKGHFLLLNTDRGEPSLLKKRITGGQQPLFFLHILSATLAKFRRMGHSLIFGIYSSISQALLCLIFLPRIFTLPQPHSPFLLFLQENDPIYRISALPAILGMELSSPRDACQTNSHTGRCHQPSPIYLLSDVKSSVGLKLQNKIRLWSSLTRSIS